MKLLALLLVSLSLCAQQVAPSTPRTVVSDTMRDFSGQVLVGDIALSLNDPQYIFNLRVAVTAGTFSVSLYPGVYSTTIHSSTFNQDRTETWSVPNSGTPVTLSTVGSSSANISAPTGNYPTSCRLAFGGDNAGPLVDSDLGPQTKMCRVNAAATIAEVVIGADSGVPSIQLQKRHCSGFSAGTCTGWTFTNILSGALAAVTGGFDACAKASTAQTCIDGSTSSSTITVSSTAVAAGDYIEPVSGTTDGTTKTISVTVVLQ